MYYGIIITDGMVEQGEREIFFVESDDIALAHLDESIYEIQCEICDYDEEPEDCELFGHLFELKFQQDFDNFENWSIGDIEMKYRRVC